MNEVKNIFQLLLEVQKEAIAPREISGKFGMGRSAEQILEAYKPVCNRHGLYLNTSDQVVQVGGRNYIKATATVVNIDSPEETYSASAVAWEGEIPISNSGNDILDASQVSGKTSSYAKKYALQNLFAIDDTKDADSQDHASHVADAAPRYNNNEAPKSEKAKAYLDSLKQQIAMTLNTAALSTVGEQKKFISDLLGKETITTIDEAKEILNEAQALNDNTNTHDEYAENAWEA